MTGQIPPLSVKRPVLLVDREKCRQNIKFMAEKAARHNLVLRPHFKTHQSLLIGEWFREAGTGKITVSSMIMAQYFGMNGWSDICVAFPFNIHEIDEAAALAGRIKLHLTVCSSETLEFIERSPVSETGIYIKIDTGYHRTGVAWDDHNTIEELLGIINRSNKLNFSGFMVHNGHTYQARGSGQVDKIHNESSERLSILKERYYRRYGPFLISSGDTPSCSLSENFDGIDEIRPGNYVFYDISQCMIGSCSTGNIAVALAVPVVAKHPDRQEIVVYGGAVHLSKEHLKLDDGTQVWGQVAETDLTSWSEPVPGAWVTKLSQEHGTISCDREFFNKTTVGDIIAILPVHSCLTADLMKGYISTAGMHIDHLSGYQW